MYGPLKLLGGPVAAVVCLLLSRRKFGVDGICLQAMLCFIRVESSWMRGALIKEVLALAVGPQSQPN